jgi:allatostatin receptor
MGMNGFGSENAQFRQDMMFSVNATEAVPLTTQFYDEFTVNVYQFLVPSLFTVIVAGGLAGNVLVIVAVLTCKKLQTVTNYFLVNLSVADVAFLLICGSFSVAHYIIAQWPFGETLCRVIQYLLYVTCYVVIYTLTLVSFVRYVTVVHGSKTAVLRSRTFVICANVAIWVACLLAKLPILVVHGVSANPEERRTECIISGKRYGQNLFATFFVFAYGLPLCVICSLYIAIIVHLRNKRSRSASIGGIAMATRGGGGGGEYGAVNNTSPSLLSSLTAVKERQRKHRHHATKIIILVVAVFAVCWLPLHIHLLVAYYGTVPSSHLYKVCVVVFHALAYSNSLLNPLIYNFCSKDFRAHFADVILCRRQNMHAAVHL